MVTKGNLSIFLTVLCVAASLGTLTSAAIVVAAYILVVFFLPILIVPYAAWALWARFMLANGLLRPLPKFVAVLATLIAVPLCAFLPYQIASYEMRLRAADTPTHSSMKVSKIVADPFGNSTSGPGVIYYLEPLNDSLAALRTLQDHLIAEDWYVVFGSIPNARGSDASLLFSGPSGQSLSLRATWNRTLHQYSSITLRRNFTPVSPSVLILFLLVTAATSVAYATRKGRKPDDAKTL